MASKGLPTLPTTSEGSPRGDCKEDCQNSTLVYMIFILIGCSSLLPWNATITATEFFKSKYCGTDFEHLFETYYTLEFTTAQLLGLLSQLYLEIRCGYMHTVTKPLFFSALLFTILSSSTYFDSIHGESYFYFTSPIIFLLGFATIFLTSGVFARSANFQSTKLSQGAMFGQAFSGVFVSLLSFSLASTSDLSDDDAMLDDNEQSDCNSGTRGIVKSAQTYFVICSIAMWISLAAFASSKLTGTVVYNSLKEKTSVENIMELEIQDAFMSNTSGDDNDEKTRMSEIQTLYEPRTKIISYDSADSVGVPVEGIENFEILDANILGDTSIHTILEVMNTLKFFIAVIILTFAGTLSIFPALVSEVWECSNKNNAAFTAILFLAFNIFDAIGRGLSAYANDFNSCLLYTIAVLAAAKLGVIPLLADSNIHGNELKMATCYDMYPVSLICTLGLTNGFCASCCMMHWSKILKDPSKENVGATLMIFSITTGLITGSLLSYIVVQFVLYRSV